MKMETMMVLLGLASVAYAHSLFPVPKTVSLGSTEVTVNPQQFSMTANVNSALLNDCIKRYTVAGGAIFPFGFTKASVMTAGPLLTTMQIVVASGDETLQLGVDESYALDIPEGGTAGKITANTVYGAMRAIETFSQLVQGEGEGYTVPYTPCSIQDTPRFPWRGLMMDTARHFQEIGAIRQLIDTLAWNRFNTLHWHGVDSQSFPLQSLKMPNLTLGAWHPNAVYSPTDMQEIVEYAKSRGIRVVLETDVPAHASSWGVGEPGLALGACDSLDPTKEEVYTALETVWSEWTQSFPEATFHTGGDELQLTCWAGNAKIQAFMKAKQMTTAEEVEAYFENRVNTILYKLNRTQVVWEEIFLNNIAQNLPHLPIVHVWKDGPTLEKVVKAGLSGLLSFGWYLDQQTPAGEKYYLWEDTWKTFYKNEPFANTHLTPAEEALVLGGEACMWGEQVDSANIVSRVWPRASAVAERLWSPATVTDLVDAERRLKDHRCRLRRRGIPAGPIEPDYCVLPKHAEVQWPPLGYL